MSAPTARPESDMSVWWRARTAGWNPRPEHLLPQSVKLAPGWRLDAQLFLARR